MRSTNGYNRNIAFVYVDNEPVHTIFKIFSRQLYSLRSDIAEIRAKIIVLALCLYEQRVSCQPLEKVFPVGIPISLPSEVLIDFPYQQTFHVLLTVMVSLTFLCMFSCSQFDRNFTPRFPTGSSSADRLTVLTDAQPWDALDGTLLNIGATRVCILCYNSTYLTRKRRL